MLCVCVLFLSTERSGRREIKTGFLMRLEGHCENDVTFRSTHKRRLADLNDTRSEREGHKSN